MRLPNSPTGLRSDVDAINASDTIDAKDAKWFAVHTKPRAEDKVVVHLGYRGIPTFLPRLLVRHRHGSRRWEAQEPLFPGYLFARFLPEPYVISGVRWTPGVVKLLGDGERPVPLADEVVTYLQERVGERGYVVPSPTFSQGTRVRFRSGPFACLEGIIERYAPRSDRVRVLLELLTLRVSVEVDAGHLTRV
jgi:transcriptional antiterminator RfaH